MLPARGVTATVAGVHVAADTQALLDQQGAEAPPDVERHAAVYTARGCTVIYLALNGDAAGFIALADTLRPDAGRSDKAGEDALPVARAAYGRP